MKRVEEFLWNLQKNSCEIHSLNLWIFYKVLILLLEYFILIAGKKSLKLIVFLSLIFWKNVLYFSRFFKLCIEKQGINSWDK